LKGLGYIEYMNDDQMIRGAISAASIPVWAWLIQKTKAHLSAARDKHGCGLPERIGRRFGKGCAVAYRSTQQALREWRIGGSASK
ncbi:hypothetical protein, partial [Streptococcus pneumoniae]|uniref:hypothetical protein n=1 Tax=Streptococcus pneumoniae TaxID=1313 RepID=UPI001E2D6190